MDLLVMREEGEKKKKGKGEIKGWSNNIVHIWYSNKHRVGCEPVVLSQ